MGGRGNSGSEATDGSVATDGADETEQRMTTDETDRWFVGGGVIDEK